MTDTQDAAKVHSRQSLLPFAMAEGVYWIHPSSILPASSNQQFDP